MRALLIATYDMGRQPFGLASPAAWLRGAGVEVLCLDLSREPFRSDLFQEFSGVVAFYLPMHTATRLAVPVIKRIRALNPALRLCCYGLYAPLNAEMLHGLGVTDILGGEFEASLVDVVTGSQSPASASAPTVPRLDFLVPDRSTLLPPQRYASLQLGPRRRVVGYTEASRGCKHHCRHCPIVPVYEGQFRVVPVSIVLEDIRQQVEKGAQHITFGDPDFFNGIGHATAIVEALARAFPDLTYDVTIKVEHLLLHREQLARLRATGCLLVTSAVESFDDAVLTRLRKGHTRAGVYEAVEACRQHDLTVVPTFVPFTPWTTIDTYRQFLGTIADLELVDHVAPIQLVLRLLVPRGSRLVEVPDLVDRLLPFDTERLVHPWRHSDRRVDELCDEVGAVVGRQPNRSRREMYRQVWETAHATTGGQTPVPFLPPLRAEIPYLNEPWYC